MSETQAGMSPTTSNVCSEKDSLHGTSTGSKGGRRGGKREEERSEERREEEEKEREEWERALLYTVYFSSL